MLGGLAYLWLSWGLPLPWLYISAGPHGARFGALQVLRMGIVASFLSLLAWPLRPMVIHALFPLNALSIVVNPMIQSILSNSVDERQQGELQGLSTAIASSRLFWPRLSFFMPLSGLCPMILRRQFSLASLIAAPMIALMALTWRAKSV